MVTRTRAALLLGVAALAVLGWLLGVGVLPLAAITFGAAALIVLSPRRVPVRYRLKSGDALAQDARFGWAHPLATSMLVGGFLFGWFNGTGGSDQIGPGGADGLGGTDFGGGDFGGGGGTE